MTPEDHLTREKLWVKLQRLFQRKQANPSLECEYEKTLCEWEALEKRLAPTHDTPVILHPEKPPRNED